LSSQEVTQTFKAFILMLRYTSISLSKGWGLLSKPQKPNHLACLARKTVIGEAEVLAWLHTPVL